MAWGQSRDCTRAVLRSSLTQANVLTRQPSHQAKLTRGISLAESLAAGIARPALKQGAVGTTYFEPGGVSFWE